MISKRSFVLFLAPVQAGTLLHATPIVYNPDTLQLQVAQGSTAFLFSFMGCVSVSLELVLMIIHTHNVVNGCVPLDELLMASIQPLLYSVLAGLFVISMCYTEDIVKIINEVRHLDQELCKSLRPTFVPAFAEIQAFCVRPFCCTLSSQANISNCRMSSPTAPRNTSP